MLNSILVIFRLTYVLSVPAKKPFLLKDWPVDPVRQNDKFKTLRNKKQFHSCVIYHLITSSYDSTQFWPSMIFKYTPTVHELEQLSEEIRINNERIPHELSFLGDEIESDEELMNEKGLQALCDGLKSSKYVRVFTLSDHKLPSSASLLAEVLRENSDLLVFLNLSGNNIDDDSVKHIGEVLKAGKNQNLSALCLYNNNISVGGARHLSEGLKHCALRLLNLNDNKIGDNGAKFIADALKSKKKLEKLYLRRNDIGVNGTKFLADSLTQNYNLKHLDLSGNKVGDAIENIANALKVNEVLEAFHITRSEIKQHDRQRLFHDQLYFSVIFNQDKFGFAIGSTLAPYEDQKEIQVGPYVCKLDPEGEALVKGVKVGDRIKLVNNVPITEDMTWEGCQEVLQSQKKPIAILFEKGYCRDSRIKLSHY